MEYGTSIGLIYGSIREGRMCDTVAGWVERQLFERSNIVLYAIDPAYPDTRKGIEGRNREARIALSKRLQLCDGFIVVTPESSHSISAPLKALIDSAKPEWATKPVAFVSYGGASGGIRAVEQLRLAFDECHAVSIRDSVAFTNVRRAFDQNGEPVEREMSAKAFDIMLRRLIWWATALKKTKGAPAARAVAV